MPHSPSHLSYSSTPKDLLSPLLLQGLPSSRLHYEDSEGLLDEFAKRYRLVVLPQDHVPDSQPFAKTLIGEFDKLCTTQSTIGIPEMKKQTCGKGLRNLSAFINHGKRPRPRPTSRARAGAAEAESRSFRIHSINKSEKVRQDCNLQLRGESKPIVNRLKQILSVR
jgi:hypothetical protein